MKEEQTDILERMRSWPEFQSLRLLSSEEVQALQEKYRSGISSDAPRIRRHFEAQSGFWQEFQPGDDVYEYSSSQASWDAGFGHGGFLIRRQGEEVERFRTSWN